MSFNTKDVIIEILKTLWLFIGLGIVVFGTLSVMKEEGKVKTGSGTQYEPIKQNRK